MAQLSIVIKKQLLPILKKHEVKSASVFGSFATGEVDATSDLDLLVEFSGEKGLFDLVRLQLELEKIMKCDVDVVTLQALHPLLKDRVLMEQVKVL